MFCRVFKNVRMVRLRLATLTTNERGPHACAWGKTEKKRKRLSGHSKVTVRGERNVMESNHSNRPHAACHAIALATAESVGKTAETRNGAYCV